MLYTGAHHFANKGPCSWSHGFSSSHVWMWKVDHKEGWVLKNWSFRTVVLEKTLERPLDSKEIKPVNPKGNQPWISVEGLMLKLKLQCFGHLGKVNTWHTGKDSDAGKDWPQEEKGMTEDEMVGWHHRLNGHEFEQTSGDSEGQGSLTCCSPWACQVGHGLVTEQQQRIWNVKVALLCPTLCNPMDCIVHGILQARILEWVAFPFSRVTSQPRDRT